MTHAEFSAWSQAWQIGVCLAGLIGIVFGIQLERLAQRRGWRTVRRLVPAFVVALILAILSVAQNSGYLPAPPKSRKQVAWMPFCDDWFYYVQPACWFMP